MRSSVCVIITDELLIKKHVLTQQFFPEYLSCPAWMNPKDKFIMNSVDNKLNYGVASMHLNKVVSRRTVWFSEKYI